MPQFQSIPQPSKPVLTLVSKKTQFTKRQPLWEAVALAYASQKQLASVSPVWVYLRVEELGLKVKTPKGKKGRVAGSSPVIGERTTRGEKFAKDNGAVAFFARMEGIIKKEQKGRFLPLLEKARGGSVKALVKLKCLDCANWQTNEVKHCQCLDCPLLIIRPYQTTKEEVEDGDSEVCA